MDEQRFGALLEFAERAEDELRGPNTGDWLSQFDGKRSEIDEALEWSLEHDPSSGLEIAVRIWRFWLLRGHVTQGRRRLSELLQASEDADPGTRARALYAAGTLAVKQEDLARARTLHRESLMVARELGDHLAMIAALMGLARVSLAEGDLAAAAEFGRDGRRIAREFGDRAAEQVPVHALAAVARMTGELDEARELYREGLAICEEVGDVRAVAGELHNLGYVELHSGRVEVARELFRRTAEVAKAQQDTYLIAFSLLDFAILAAADGTPHRSATLLAAADASFKRNEQEMDPDDRQEYDRVLTELRGQLDASTFDVAWAHGEALSPERALAYAETAERRG